MLAATASATTSAAAAEDDLEAGRDVFEANCAMRHGADAAGMMGMHPSLRGAVERLSREGVEVTVRNGRNTTPPMPAFGDRLTDAQIDGLIASIASLPEGPRNFGPGERMREGDMMDNGRMMGDGGMMDGGMMGGFMVLWVILLLALIALAVAGVVWLVRSMGGSSRGGRSNSDHTPVRAELDRRYAAGELSRGDYLERRRDLDI